MLPWYAVSLSTTLKAATRLLCIKGTLDARFPDAGAIRRASTAAPSAASSGAAHNGTCPAGRAWAAFGQHFHHAACTEGVCPERTSHLMQEPMALPPPPPPPPPQDHHANEPPAMAPDLKDQPGQSASSTLGPITLPQPPITLPAPGRVPSPPPAPVEQAQQVSPSRSMHDMPKRQLSPVQSAYSSDVHARVPMPPPAPVDGSAGALLTLHAVFVVLTIGFSTLQSLSHRASKLHIQPVS
jgi:hypothetical protein